MSLESLHSAALQPSQGPVREDTHAQSPCCSCAVQLCSPAKELQFQKLKNLGHPLDEEKNEELRHPDLSIMQKEIPRKK